MLNFGKKQNRLSLEDFKAKEERVLTNAQQSQAQGGQVVEGGVIALRVALSWASELFGSDNDCH